MISFKSQVKGVMKELHKPESKVRITHILRELLDMLKPEHIIPAHGSLEQETPMIDLAGEFGYKFGKTSHLTSDGKVLKF